ncbi:hypothetical protein BH23GEM2_BH23GEM2_13310 [soil metagenome]
MKIFRIGAVAAALALTAGAVQAQQAEQPKADRQKAGERARGAHMGKMAQELGLTEAQRTQVQAIHERHRAQLRQLNAGVQTHRQAAAEARRSGDTAAVRAHREQARAAAEQTRAQRQQIHAAMQAEVRAVLTPEQQTKFDAQRAQMRERMEQRRQGARERGMRGGSGPRGERPARARGGQRSS